MRIACWPLRVKGRDEVIRSVWDYGMVNDVYILFSAFMAEGIAVGLIDGRASLVHYRDFALGARTPRERIVNQVQDGKRARFCSCCLPHFNFLANFNFLASMIILHYSERLFGVFLFIYFIFILNTFSISGF